MTILISPNEKKQLKEELVAYIDKHVLFRADPDKYYADSKYFPKGKMISKAGANLMTHQYMMRRLTHNPDMLTKAAVYIFDEIIIKLKNGEEYPQFQFCGLETGSLPLIAALQVQGKALGISINAFTVRKERKGYGLFHFIEGIPDNSPFVLIDDLINSGSSIKRAGETAIYEYGLTPAHNSYTIVSFDCDTYVRQSSFRMLY